MNLRTSAILKSLEFVSNANPESPITLIEVGSMYREIEGLSMFIMADFLANRPKGGRLISIEYDSTHIVACQDITKRLNPGLANWIKYHHGIV